MRADVLHGTQLSAFQGHMLTVTSPNAPSVGVTDMHNDSMQNGSWDASWRCHVQRFACASPVSQGTRFVLASKTATDCLLDYLIRKETLSAACADSCMCAA